MKGRPQASLHEGEVVFFHNKTVTNVKHISALLAAAAMTSFVKINYNNIWKPWWQKPAFLGAAGAAVIGGGYFILKPSATKDLPGPPGLPPER